MKIFIRLLHIFYFVLPYKRSYKIGPVNIIPKFIVATPFQISFFNELIKESNKYNIKFEEKIRAVASGQSAVFYDNNVCLGGGIITETY